VPSSLIFFTESEILNFKKLMLIVVAVVVLIVGYQFLTKVDRTNPIKVANAFTKALKSGQTSTAAKYYVPTDAAAWEEQVGTMKSGALDRFRERIPSDPEFTTPTTSKTGVTTIESGDKAYSLEMKQIDGKWYVSKAS
jgi:hypothetical protein